MQSDVVVHIVDDDAAVRHSLGLLMKSVDIQARSYASAREFLDSFDPSSPGCLILDIRMPEMGGLELQRLLMKQKIQLPVIIITGHGDVPLAVRAMKEGAMDFIEKPFHDQDLIDSIARAVAKSIRMQNTQRVRTEFHQRTSGLSSRELEVMELLVDGKSSKEIASTLGISPKTVDVHRGHIMEKMQVKTVIELVHLTIMNTPG